MIIAVLGDIHGNTKALEAVLEDIDSKGVLTIFNTGDLVCGHPDNSQVIEHLRNRNIPSAKGHWDHLLVRYMRKKATLEKKLSPDDLDLVARAHEQCTTEQIEYLNGLPRTHKQTIDAIDIALCHGTINSNRDSLKAGDNDDKFMRQRELEPAQIIITGKTHEPHARQIGDTLFVNPGSVGQNDDDIARYALVSTEEIPWSVDFLEIPIN